MNVFHVLRLLSAISICAICNQSIAAQSYEFTALGTADTGTWSGAFGINNFGQVVGTGSVTKNGPGHAILWSGGTATDLGALPGKDSAAHSINNVGQIAGYRTTADGAQHAIVWNGTTPTDLGTLGGTNSLAFGINDAGQVVGYSHPAGGFWEHATIWNGTTPTDLVGSAGSTSYGLGVNSAGQVVGVGHVGAAIWNGSIETALGTLGGTYSYAHAINDVGQVAGYGAITGDIAAHAIVWNGTTPTDLGTLGGANSYAYGINKSGQVVGYAQDRNGKYFATLWNGTNAIDLNMFVIGSGWVLQEARAINDNGWIVGMAQNISTGQSSAYVLAPVPIPASAILFVSGVLSLLTASFSRRIRGPNRT